MPKLSDKHIIPEKFSKMKVKCATQVFSQSVAVNMGYLASKGVIDKECQDTADVILFFDNLFDSLNGSYLNSKKKAGKALLGPVRPNSIHKKVWRDAKQVLLTMKFVKNGKTTVVPSITNWLQSIKNMEYLVNQLEKRID
ncbi:unnamed protein product [Parnassius mnemosyne]|uniref:Transposable element P transposase-like GTP-binding insertion domain-containing protein n=2 Tax=Parnassius mnemosyne TaxID=213953 RepID=A0AAV1KRB9_9NEOP